MLSHGGPLSVKSRHSGLDHRIDACTDHNPTCTEHHNKRQGQENMSAHLHGGKVRLGLASGGLPSTENKRPPLH